MRDYLGGIVTEIKKYAVRFGVITAIAIVCMAIAGGANAIKLITYKI